MPTWHVLRCNLQKKKTIQVNVTANKKQEKVQYSHDEVYNTHKDKFENMNCFEKYKSYTNSNCVPKFCRDLQTIVE